MKRDEIIEKWERMRPISRDVWVAETVWRDDDEISGWLKPDGCASDAVPDYTTDISAAWAVAENFPYHGVEHSTLDEPTARYVSRMGRPGERLAVAYAPTAPEAICLAALIAKLTEGAD